MRLSSADFPKCLRLRPPVDQNVTRLNLDIRMSIGVLLQWFVIDITFRSNLSRSSVDPNNIDMRFWLPETSISSP